jgi:hypothetical protein
MKSVTHTAWKYFEEKEVTMKKGMKWRVEMRTVGGYDIAL